MGQIITQVHLQVVLVLHVHLYHLADLQQSHHRRHHHHLPHLHLLYCGVTVKVVMLRSVV